MDYNKLTPEEEKAFVNKATEVPFEGEYSNFYGDGAYICQRRNTTPFPSKSKLDSGCGWPIFDENLSNAIKRTADFDGLRTEIQCTNCNAHLGHEFVGEEHFTDKNTRERFNSDSLYIFFIPKEKELPKTIHE